MSEKFLRAEKCYKKFKFILYGIVDSLGTDNDLDGNLLPVHQIFLNIKFLHLLT